MTQYVVQVSHAGKRLSPTDPDRSRPKPAVLPWWDMMRFTWRGGIAVTATYDRRLFLNHCILRLDPLHILSTLHWLRTTACWTITCLFTCPAARGVGTVTCLTLSRTDFVVVHILAHYAVCLQCTRWYDA